MKQKNISISKFLYKNIRWILFVIALLIFFLLAITVLNQGEFAFDEQAFKVLKNWESPGLTAFFKTVTALASAPVLILFCLLIFIFIKKRTYFYLVGLNLINTVVLNSALKSIFRRERPIESIIEESGYSFPSGHSMASLAFYGFLIYLLYKSSIQKKLKIFLITVLVIIIILIGTSRIYLGVHYLSDVLAGFSFTLAYLIIFTKLITNYTKEK